MICLSAASRIAPPGPVTAPPAISAAMRERLKSGAACASALSSRPPVSTTMRRGVIAASAAPGSSTMTDPRRAAPDDDEPPEPPRLRALRRMVAALTAVLILGVVTVAGALVIRIAAPGHGGRPAAGPVSAERVALPEGETITALGAGGGLIAVATRDAEGRERLRFFHADDGGSAGVVEIGRRSPGPAPAADP